MLRYISRTRLVRQLVQVRLNHFDAPHLAKCDANYAQLTPLSTFHRAAKLFPTKPAYVSMDSTKTWGEMHTRVNSLASALTKAGVQRGDVVSIMGANSGAMFEAHFAVPGINAVLHSINIRLDATTVAFQLNHSEAKVVILDTEFNDIMQEAVAIARQNPEYKIPKFIFIKDSSEPVMDKPHITEVNYETFVKSGDAGFELPPVQDEWDAISLNYTSGTTGNPKGVVCTHRGAYLNSISNIVEWNMEKFSKMLMSKPPATASCATISILYFIITMVTIAHITTTTTINTTTTNTSITNTITTHTPSI